MALSIHSQSNSTQYGELTFHSLEQPSREPSLHLSDRELIPVQPKSPAYVLGEQVVGPLLRSINASLLQIGNSLKTVQSTGSNGAKKIAKRITNIPWCLERYIRSKYLDQKKKPIFRAVCTNNVTQLEINLAEYDEVIEKLISAIARNTSLKSLTLTHFNYESQDPIRPLVVMSRLTTALSMNTTIEKLEFATDVGTREMSNFLRSARCYNLTELVFKSVDQEWFKTDLVKQSIFSRLFEEDSFFPLRTIRIHSPVSIATLESLAEGISNQSCIKVIHGELKDKDSISERKLKKLSKTILEKIRQNPSIESFFDGGLPEDLDVEVKALIASKQKEKTISPECMKREKPVCKVMHCSAGSIMQKFLNDKSYDEESPKNSVLLPYAIYSLFALSSIAYLCIRLWRRSHQE